MEIIFDSRDIRYKCPFGCISAGEVCTVCIYLKPNSEKYNVYFILEGENGTYEKLPMRYTEAKKYSVSFILFERGLYFYHFDVFDKDGTCSSFYKDTYNHPCRHGAKWQISAVYGDRMNDFGGVMYQIFPDRFAISGNVLTYGKIEPYTIHKNTSECPDYKFNDIYCTDFFGGNFGGITEKLGYISGFGVKYIYLNPIFKSRSNHRYDTANYEISDEMLGSIEDFKKMCDTAHGYGIKIILDGVFSHTGSCSIYFDKDGIFGRGACSAGESSPYYEWYDFFDFPQKYACWWGIDTLPCVNENNKSYIEYMITGKDSVIKRWMSYGADGFRLDVADELPDEFIRILYSEVKKIKPDSLIIGEVWEDASNKISYGKRRTYFCENELDGVMNYPFRNSLIKLIKGQCGIKDFAESIMSIAENYPHEKLCNSVMHLSTHDTPRILTELFFDVNAYKKDAQSELKIPKESFEHTVKILKCILAVAMMLPGIFCIYYGDEAGAEGANDPFNRRFFPWGNENRDIFNFYLEICRIKSTSEILNRGKIKIYELSLNVLKISRAYGGKEISAVINLSDEPYKFCMSTLCKRILSSDTNAIKHYDYMIYECLEGEPD